MAAVGSKIQRLAAFPRPTVFGEFNVVCYQKDGGYSFAVVKGDLPRDDVVVRIQSPCLFGESFGVNSCDCGAQLTKALQFGSQNLPFMLIYSTNQEGRSLGLHQKIKAIETEALQHVDMVEAFQILSLPLDLREYSVAAEIIRDLNGERPVRLMTNNPKKVDGLAGQGIQISERVPLLIDPPNEACRKYLATKKHKMGHVLPNVE